MDDPLLEGDEELTLACYIIQQALQESELHDELLVQLCNQTWGSQNQRSRERGWMLLSLALGVFSPSKKLENYLLKLAFLHFSYKMQSPSSVFYSYFLHHFYSAHTFSLHPFHPSFSLSTQPFLSLCSR